MGHKISWKEYEQAFSKKLLHDFPPPAFKVVWNDRSNDGRYSKVKRQLDVAVYRADQSHPFLVAETKRRGKAIDVGHIDCFIGKLDDLGPEIKIGVFVSLTEPSPAAKCRAASVGIKMLVVSAQQALEFPWWPVAREVFPWDWAFHPHLAKGLYCLQRGDEPSDVIEAIESIPFDEWQEFVKYGLEHFRGEAISFLRFIALHHLDDGWRFNAVQQLIDSNALSQDDIDRILAQESDPDIIEILKGPGFI